MTIFYRMLCVASFLVMTCHPTWALDDTDSRFIYPEYSKRISMDFKEASLTDVLKIFSKQSGMNFIAAEDISDKKLTLFLDNIPVEMALEKILDANGLTYEFKAGSDIFVVKPKIDVDSILLTRVYPLKYATVPSSKLNQTIAISSDVGSNLTTTTSTSSTSSSSSSGAASAATSSSNSAEGLLMAVQAVLSKSGNVVEDPRTNSLIITDIEKQFPVIEKTIAQLDVPVAQILIEVEMLDVSRQTADKMGVKFKETLLSFKGAGRTSLLPFDEQSVDKNTTDGKFTFTQGSLGATGMEAILQFLRTETDTRNLARPRILTLNNQTAQIKISTNEAIGVSTITDNTQSGSSNTSVEAERVETGVFLTVTPQANVSVKEILMAIYPKVIQARIGGTFGDRTFKDPEERGSQSILRVQDGETVMIGGLLREDASVVATKVPGAADIPIIGGAFRHKDRSDTRRELIIFITPHIVDESNKSILKLQNQESTSGDLSLKSGLSHSMNRLEQVDKALNVMQSKQR